MASTKAVKRSPEVGVWVSIRGKRRNTKRWSGFVTEEWIGKIIGVGDGGFIVCYATPKAYMQDTQYFVPSKAIRREIAPTDLPAHMGWMFDTPLDALCAAAHVT